MKDQPEVDRPAGARYALQRTVPGIDVWDRIRLAMTADATPRNTPNDELASHVVIKDRRRRGLRKAGALQNAILNSAGFSSVAIDEKGVIQIFNAGAKRMLGYSRAEVVDKFTPADFSDPAEGLARAEALSVEFATPICPGFEALAFKASRGIEDKYELTYIRKDGSRLAAVLCVTALHDATGEIVGYLLIATDNTARKRMEEELRRTEETFRLMVESVSDCAIVQLDAEGQVLSWNAGAQIIDGYSAQEIVGQHFSRFYSGEEIGRGVPQRDLAAAAAAGRYETQGWRARKDGSTYRAHIVLTSIHDEAGVLRGFARLTRDITEPVERPEPALQPRAPSGMPRRRLLLRAASVNLAIELAQAAGPEAILMNIDLPGIGAIEFMKILRADPATQNTPILALSANGAPDAIVKALEAGFFHYLTKPLKPEPFMEALGEALEFAAVERAEENDRVFTSAHIHQRSHQ